MRINLIPPEERVSRRLVPLEPILAAVAALAVMGALATASVSQQQLAEANRRVESLRRLVAELKPYQEQLAQLRQQTQELEKALQRTAGQEKGQATPALSELMQSVGDAAWRTGTVWLTRLTASQGRLQIEGLATDAASVTRFLTQLTAGGGLQQTQGGLSPVDAPQATGDAGSGASARGSLVRFWSELKVSGVGEGASTAKTTP